MARKGHIAKRDVLVDPIYNSKLVTRLINKIMLDGKKGVAQNILYSAFTTIEDKTGQQPMEVFEKASANRDVPFMAQRSLSNKRGEKQWQEKDISLSVMYWLTLFITPSLLLA